MKSILQKSILIGAILLSTSQVFAYPVNFIGVWKNVNPNTKGIVSFTVTPGLNIRMYGACTPLPCDNGTVPLTTFGANVSDLNHRSGLAHYFFSFKKVGVILKLNSSKNITLDHFNQFTDGSGRQNYRMTETFKRTFPFDNEEIENLE